MNEKKLQKSGIQMSVATWLKEMPEIPLARAVPVVGPAPHYARAVVTKMHHGVDAGPIITDTNGENIPDASGLRVDLTDPQGFGYALRWYVSRPNSNEGVQNWLLRWFDNTTTDADRLALARALTDVLRSENS